VAAAHDEPARHPLLEQLQRGPEPPAEALIDILVSEHLTSPHASRTQHLRLTYRPADVRWGAANRHLDCSQGRERWTGRRVWRGRVGVVVDGSIDLGQIPCARVEDNYVWRCARRPVGFREGVPACQTRGELSAIKSSSHPVIKRRAVSHQVIKSSSHQVIKRRAVSHQVIKSSSHQVIKSSRGELSVIKSSRGELSAKLSARLGCSHGRERGG
jgi:hypothetical protein